MTYEMVEECEFWVLGVSRVFDSATSKGEIPKFWSEYYERGYGKIACGQFGICLEGLGDGMFRYVIGNACEVEHRADGTCVYHVACHCCGELDSIPEGFGLYKIPAQTWLKVACVGPLPNSIQDMYPVLEREFPKEWVRIPWLDVEEYGKCESPDDAEKDDYRCYIWVPVKHA